ncbi:hypothetical protein TIFTF001_007084 [Ficus carica]|uniref:Uncharacterized protein n=1 Tax=Ficus carica TaxID=3494 RepID=A0AA88DG88_FICCA|nr:hypothetical protein TIFTF001_007084 [Ficus carica]
MLVIDPTWVFITETRVKDQHQIHKMPSTNKLLESIMLVINSTCDFITKTNCFRIDHGLHHLNKCYIPISDHQTMLPTSKESIMLIIKDYKSTSSTLPTPDQPTFFSCNKHVFRVDHACDRGPQIALKSIMLLVIDTTWDFITRQVLHTNIRSTNSLSTNKLLKSQIMPKQVLHSNTRSANIRFPQQTSIWS